MRTTATAVLLALVAGCSQTRTYQVSLTNHTNEPITFGLVKEGEPYDRRWASPEEAAIRQDAPNAQMWGAVDPGRTAATGPVRGRFRRNAEAELRVYLGKLSLPEILATSRGQPNRIDIPLHPGMNRFEVSDVDGHFEATRQEPPPKSPVQQQ